VAARVVLLRGINVGPNKRIAMPALREALADAGFEDVRTYVQSGNVVLWSTTSAKQLTAHCAELIRDTFGFDVDVVVRTRDELAEVVKRNPLGDVAENPKRYQVSFLSDKPRAEVVRKLKELTAPTEEFAAIGKELYAWHPEGVARSKLWNALAGQGLGVTATSRNWTTVTTLLAMADEI
jgi:uncharacterized protein (DUF1697 family)